MKEELEKRIIELSADEAELKYLHSIYAEEIKEKLELLRKLYSALYED